MNLHLDFETRSEADLKRVGVYAYAEHPSTEILCAAWAIDDSEVQLWMPGEGDAFQSALARADTITAHNATFERIMINLCGSRKYGFPMLPIEKMRCTMVQAYALGLPGNLADACAAVGLEARKDMAGHRLMLAMCKPRAPRKSDVGPGPFWRDSPADRERLAEYCKQDLIAERALARRLLPLKQSELELWFLDQRINDRGVDVDVKLAERAMAIVDDATKKLNVEMFQVSSGEVRGVTDLAGLMRFCKAHGLADQDSLAKDQLVELLVRGDLDPAVRRCLEIRQEGGRSSVTKIKALLEGRSQDGRAKGLLQFHAANTGRWAGRRFQPQNLKRPESKDQVDRVIAALMNGKDDMFELLFGPTLSAVGDAIRGMIVAAPGTMLTVADYSNIEGRVLAWLAGERWKIEAFEAFDRGEGPDIYKLSYSRSFGIPLEGVTDEQRQIGKVQELALGYQGGIGAFQSMAKNYGVKVDDAHVNDIKIFWREEHPNIVSLWNDIEYAAMMAVEKPGSIVRCGRLKFRKAGSFLFMQLPGGRAIAYPYPDTRKVPYFDTTKIGLTYKTVPDPMKPLKIIPEADGSIDMKWARISTYGGMLVENAVQAIARDVLAYGMTALDRAGYRIVMHAHDEAVCENPIGFGSEEKFTSLMTAMPGCYAGLPIAAASFRAERYRK